MSKRVTDDLPTEYREILNSYLAHIKTKPRVWIPPWRNGDTEPRNHRSLIPYLGVNQLSLWQAAYNRGYEHHRWLTAKQTQLMGGWVREGEKSTTIIFGSNNSRKEARIQEWTNRHVKRIGFGRLYQLYNISQCVGLPPMPEAPPPSPDHINPELEALIAATGTKFWFGQPGAFYHYKSDTIFMPDREAFWRPKEDFYRVVLHELAHQFMPDLEGLVWDKEGYCLRAWQEVCAELTSAFVCSQYGIGFSVDSGNYLGLWLYMVKIDRRSTFEPGWLLEALPAALITARKILAFAPRKR